MKLQTGFTLIETLVVLLLITVIAVCAIPSWRVANEASHLSVVESELVNALHHARNTALLTGKTLAISPLKDWSEGLLLFEDNPEHRYKDQDKLYYQWHWSKHSVKVIWYGFQSNNYLVFSAYPQHASLSGHFILTAGDGRQKKIIINRIGRIKRDNM